MAITFFSSWALWQKMTFVLACAILVTISFGTMRLHLNKRKLRRYEALSQAKPSQQEATATEQPLTSDVESQVALVPFGIRAIESGIEIDGIWQSPSTTPGSSRPSSATSSRVPRHVSDPSLLLSRSPDVPRVTRLHSEPNLASVTSPSPTAKHASTNSLAASVNSGSSSQGESLSQEYLLPGIRSRSRSRSRAHPSFAPKVTFAMLEDDVADIQSTHARAGSLQTLMGSEYRDPPRRDSHQLGRRRSSDSCPPSSYSLRFSQSLSSSRTPPASPSLPPRNSLPAPKPIKPSSSLHSVLNNIELTSMENLIDRQRLSQVASMGELNSRGRLSADTMESRHHSISRIISSSPLAPIPEPSTPSKGPEVVVSAPSTSPRSSPSRGSMTPPIQPDSPAPSKCEVTPNSTLSSVMPDTPSTVTTAAEPSSNIKTLQRPSFSGMRAALVEMARSRRSSSRDRLSSKQQDHDLDAAGAARKTEPGPRKLQKKRKPRSSDSQEDATRATESAAAH